MASIPNDSTKDESRLDIFCKADTKRLKSKDQVIYESHLQYGYTLKEIAEYIGVHDTTVSRAVKKIEEGDEE